METWARISLHHTQNLGFFLTRRVPRTHSQPYFMVVIPSKDRVMRALKYWPLILLAILRIGVASAADDAVETGIILQGDERPRDLGWTAGDMTVVMENSGATKNYVTLKFNGERKGPLRVVTITTNFWTLDVSKYIQKIRVPYISRAVLVVGRLTDEGRIIELGFSLPYSDVTVDHADRCMTLELGILNGRVISNDHFAAPSERCRQ